MTQDTPRTIWTLTGKDAVSFLQGLVTNDLRPLDEEHPCPALSKYSRAYLHHLIRSGEMLGMMLMSWANIAYYQSLMQCIRAAIAEGRFEDFRRQTKEQWRAGESAA